MAAAARPPDVELGHVRDGYPSLASWIARDPDNETFVFRKFDRLAARNILHLQSRLVALEHEIDQLDEEARVSNDFEARQSSRRWETLMLHASDPNRSEKKRVKKLEELKGLLREYHETLLLQSQIAELKGPSGRVHKAMCDYTSGEAFKTANTDALPIISGLAKDFLSKDKEDLVALHRETEQDYLSKVLQDNWAFQRREAVDPGDRTTIYKKRYVTRTVAVISMISAAILLVSAIVSLHSVVSDSAKLGLISMYTVLFALSVATLTNAKRSEVFASTAAYAAVLVVFVSGDLGGSSGSSGEQCLIQLDGGIFKTIQCPG